MNRCLLSMGMLMMGLGLFAQKDWDALPVPAEKDNNAVTWEIVTALSDDFNYETPYGSNKGTEFNAKWEDGYFNNYPGFGNTIWTPNNSRVTGGNLELKATSLNAAANTNNFSAIHARTSIEYPAYIETRVKIMNSVMANAVWMLSKNSAEEIDIVEAYGSSYSESAALSKNWFAQRMHLSHHTFKRDVSPILDYQPKDAGSYYLLPNGKYWRDDFHTVGVYWRDPFHLEYYVDGVLVRTVSDASMIDPEKYLGSNGLASPETILVSGAAQGWQVSNNVYPTVNELSVEANNVFKVDWIRTYKRIGGSTYVPPTSVATAKVNDKVEYANPMKNSIHVKDGSDLKKIQIYHISGVLVKDFAVNEGVGEYSVSDLSSGMYIIRVIDAKGVSISDRVVKE